MGAIAKKMTFSTAIQGKSYQEKIQQAIPDAKGRQRFQAAVIAAVANNPALQECQPASILSAALLGESLGLSPSPQLGQYYMVPYGQKASFQLGYRGMLQLALRSGYYKRLNVLTVKEGELIRFDPLTEDIELRICPDPAEREALEPVGYVAMFEYTNGFRKTIYWSKARMDAHRKRYSRSGSVWKDNYEAMAHKTMLRQLISKWGVMSAEMQTALEAEPMEEPMQEVEPDPVPEVQPVEVQVVEPEAPADEAEETVSFDDLQDPF